MAIATCGTAGCGNEGIPIEVGELTTTVPGTDEVITSSVCCGVCGQTITDIEESSPVDDPLEDD